MSSIFSSIQTSIREAGSHLQIADSLIDAMVEPNRVIEKTIYVPGLGPIDMYRIQFNNALGPYKGGIRFHPEVDQEEVKALAITMMLKCSLAGIPMGGAKGGATLDPHGLTTKQLESVSRAWMQTMHPYVGVDKDIPAPDVNTNGQIMSWMLDEYESIIDKSEPGVITGKPITLGGSLGRESATSLGGAMVLREVLKSYPLGDSERKVIIQGFGNVGSFAGTILYDQGFTIVGLSDSKGGVYREQGLNPYNFVARKEQGKNIQEIGNEIEGVKLLSNEELLVQSCDVLVPAALAGVLHKDNADKISAKIVLELANNPTTPEADEILDRKGITVVPDFLANSGGVTVSYFEWVQNRQQLYWTLQEVEKQLDFLMTQASKQVIDMATQNQLSLRKAALRVSVVRIAKAMSLRAHYE